MKACVVLGLSCFIFGGCASARSNRYTRGPQYPPTDPATIQFYHVEPDEPYERLGEIAYDGMAIASWSGAEKMLREKAAAMGADAVLVLRSGGYVSGYTPAVGSYAASQAGGAGSGAGTYVGGQPVYRKRMFALAIKFKQKSAAASPSVAPGEVAAQFMGISAAQPATISPSVTPGNDVGYLNNELNALPTASPSVAPASKPPAQGVYHRLFVVALCSDCATKEVERQIAAGLNGDQVSAVCSAELPDTDHPDQTGVDSLFRWLVAKGFDGLILITEPGGDSWKGKIALQLIDTSTRIRAKFYPADGTLHDLSSVSGIGRLLGQWLRQDGYFAER